MRLTPPTYLEAESIDGLFVCTVPPMRTRRVTKAGKIKDKITLHPSLNEWAGMHHMAKAEYKLEWEQWYQTYFRINELPRFKGEVFLAIVYWFPDNQRRDFDNYTPKFLMDALVGYGAIEDDSDKVLGAAPFMVHRHGEIPHTLIVLTQNRDQFLEVIRCFL